MSANKKISVRFTDLEYQNILASAKSANLSLSNYIRVILTSPSAPLDNNQKSQNTITKLCTLQMVLVEEGLDNNETLVTAVNDVWQTLF